MTVLKILTYALESTWSLVSSRWEHIKRKCTPASGQPQMFYKTFLLSPSFVEEVKIELQKSICTFVCPVFVLCFLWNEDLRSNILGRSQGRPPTYSAHKTRGKWAQTKRKCKTTQKKNMLGVVHYCTLSLSDLWVTRQECKVGTPYMRVRAEWKHTFLEIAKGAHGLWSTSQHWFQNNWRNHYRMNILLRNRENISYRCKKCLPIFGKGYSSDNNFVNCYGISAVTYTGNCSGLLQNDVKICKTKNGQTT